MEDTQYFGFYKGSVADTNDTDNLGRLKLSVPQIYGDETYDYWAYPLGLFAGKDIGFFAIPNKGDNVWVTFENGDPRYPLWCYGWWGDNQAPKTAKPEVKVLQTTKGHKIEFDDEKGILRVSDCNKNVVEMNDKGVSIISNNISLGKLDKSKEPAVLGDTLEKLLQQMMEDLGNVKTIQTSNGVTAALNTAANWGTFKSKWDAKWQEFKSNVVNLEKDGN